MNIDPQEYLKYLMELNKILFVDIEATGLRGDYNSILCVSMRPYNKRPICLAVEQPGNDKQLVKQVKKILEDYPVWATYYGKGFDLPMINTRLLYHRLMPVEKRPHIDMYYMLKSNLNTSRRSQGHLLTWLGTQETKMGVSAEEWNHVLANPKSGLKIMIARCNSDTLGLKQLFDRTYHLIRDVKR